MNDVTDVATRFVDLALRYSDWNKVKVEDLHGDEVSIFLETIRAAGFGDVKIIMGKLVGRERDCDGRYSGETWQINETCPYKVTSSEGVDHHPASVWLNGLMGVVKSSTQQDLNLQQIIERVQLEIERSVPLKPIQLSDVGDFLLEYPPSNTMTFPDHSKDDNKLSSCVGIHEHCHGWVDRKRTSKTHDVLVCRSCFLRIVFPAEIKTYGELRIYMNKQFHQKK
jgi:hypothetical protein